MIALAAAVAASTSDDGGFSAPSISEFFPGDLTSGPLYVTRIHLIGLLMTGLVALFFVVAFAKPKLVPSGVQNFAEWAVEGMEKAIVGEVMGKKGVKYAPYLLSMFFILLAFNSTGVLPLMHIPVTAVIGVPFVFAIVAWVVFNVAGIRALGFLPYMKANLFPPGIPGPIYLLVTPIEFISTFILRPVTLTIRLLANMMAGHLLLVLFFSATAYFLLDADGFLKVFAIPSYAMGFAFTLFEILVIFLQAYIFTLLTAVYIDGATSAEH